MKKKKLAYLMLAMKTLLRYCAAASCMSVGYLSIYEALNLSISIKVMEYQSTSNLTAGNFSIIRDLKFLFSFGG